MACRISRRKLLKLSAASVLGGAYHLAGAEEQAVAKLLTGVGASAGSLLREGKRVPCGKLGDLSVCRLILGGNLIAGWAHSRDLMYVSDLFKAYNTRERIMNTLRMAEALGVNTTLFGVDELHYQSEYNREFGGNMQSITQVRSPASDPFRDVDRAGNLGTDTMYVNGAEGDHLVKHGRIDHLAELLERMRSYGGPVGLGAHSLKVIEESERLGLEVDYYVKTFHPESYWSAHPRENRREFEVDGQRHLDHGRFHDNMFDLFPDKTAAFMQSVSKPWIAFKILAAGAVSPAEGFQYAFSNGADFAAVGMFDFQLEEDAEHAFNALEQARSRLRAWC